MPQKIKIQVFDDLRKSIEHALAFEQGRRPDLRVAELPPSPRILPAIAKRNSQATLKT
ncbi:MAG: hypothetical protein WB780_05505 [Candidatus Acidiferrales bacterium]